MQMAHSKDLLAGTESQRSIRWYKYKKVRGDTLGNISRSTSLANGGQVTSN